MKPEEIQSKDVIETVPSVPAITTESFFRKLLQNIENWAEVTLWLPLTILSIYGLAYLAYFLTGRAPRLNMDFLPELGLNFFKIVAAIVFTSVTKQALFGWLTTEQKLDYPVYSLCRSVLDIVILLTFLYVLFNR